MPRRPAAERHLDSTPESPVGPDDPRAPLDALIAFHHPTRRRIYELLSLGGPASVGTIAKQLGIAAGSISHHLKPLHANGFVEPAPELARDTRESWWRARSRRMTWAVSDYRAGTAQEVALAAEQANLEYHIEKSRQWYAERDGYAVGWNDAGSATEVAAVATLDQVGELSLRLNDVMRSWSRGCKADRQAHPEAERMPVFAFAHVLPTMPGAPRR